MRAMPITLVTVAALLVGGTAFARRETGASLDPAAPRAAIPGTDSLLARVALLEAPRAIELVVGPVSLEPGTEGLSIPVQLVRLPVDGWLQGFSWSLHDGQGRRLPDELLHHVNLIDPDRRELFSATARRVIAAGSETEAFAAPAALAYPVTAGTRLLVAAMFANPGAEPVPDARLRVRLRYSPRPRPGPEPLPIFPFHLDVMGPVGAKSFAVPPGRTVQSWEGSPAADVRVLALGGHLHDHARRVALEDVTAGRTLWQAEPVVQAGRVVAVPRAQPWRRGGMRLYRDRVYRVTVEYDNPTAASLPHGGMGLVAGVVTGSRGWPAVDRSHPDYAADLASLVAAPQLAEHDHGGHSH